MPRFYIEYVQSASSEITPDPSGVKSKLYPIKSAVEQKVHRAVRWQIADPSGSSTPASAKPQPPLLPPSYTIPQSSWGE